MSVYSNLELIRLDYDSWVEMLNIHKKDLEMYYKSEEYPARKRDIEETHENIYLLTKLIKRHEEDRSVRF